MKIRIDTDSAYDGPFSETIKVENLIKRHDGAQGSAILGEFLLIENMLSITVDFGDEWYRYTKINE